MPIHFGTPAVNRISEPVGSSETVRELPSRVQLQESGESRERTGVYDEVVR